MAEKYEAVMVYEVPYEALKALERGESVWLTGTRLHAPGVDVTVACGHERSGGIVEESNRVDGVGWPYGEIKLVGW